MHPSATTILRRGLPSVAKNLLLKQQGAFSTLANTVASSVGHSSHQEMMTGHFDHRRNHPSKNRNFQVRLFSAVPHKGFEADVVQDGPGFVTKKLRALNMATVKTIMEELKAVDADQNQR